MVSCVYVCHVCAYVLRCVRSAFFLGIQICLSCMSIHIAYVYIWWVCSRCKCVYILIKYALEVHEHAKHVDTFGLFIVWFYI